MAGKKMEGDEDQRRAAARAAREAGEEPSAAGVTLGASKQPEHLRHGESLSHEERLAERHRGKQQGLRPSGAPPRADAEPMFPDDRPVDYDEVHQRVFQVLAEAEALNGGQGVYLDDVAEAARLARDETRLVLHDLVTVQKLVTELEGADDPDLGPRFITKPRL